jgi:hypothetical protein
LTKSPRRPLLPGANSVSASELRQIAAQRSEGRIAVVALDATWDGANRMKLSYPEHVMLGQCWHYYYSPCHTYFSPSYPYYSPYYPYY